MDNQQTTQDIPSVSPRTPVAPASQGGQSLIKQSWQSFKNNMAAIWLTVFISSLLSFLGSAFLSAGMAQGVRYAQGTATADLNALLAGLPALLSYIIAALLMIASIWFMLATIKIIRNQANSLSLALNQSVKLILPAVWMGLLVYFSTLGGGALLLIPGLILAVWFSFSYFIFFN